MHVTMAFVISVDGKITRGEDPHIHAWSSKEDWDHFVALRMASDAVILDRPTFEAVRPVPEPGKLRVVLTRHPDLNSALTIPGQLEFVSATPVQLMKRLKVEGYKNIMLAGGRQMSHDFLAAGLVDDLYVTLEPLLFGHGALMLADKPLDVELQLESVKTLNKRGSLLVHYLVQKKH